MDEKYLGLVIIIGELVFQQKKKSKYFAFSLCLVIFIPFPTTSKTCSQNLLVFVDAKVLLLIEAMYVVPVL